MPRTSVTRKKKQSVSAKRTSLIDQLRKYQITAVKWFITRPGAGAFLDPGLGKTVISLAAFDILQSKSYVNGMLVVAPLRPMYNTWPGEVQRWGLKYKVAILHGPKKAKALKEKADIYLINYDGLPWLEKEIEAMERPPFNMVVFDESSKLRNTNTNRFKTVRQLLKRFRRRYILTGTPAPKGLMNLFGQVFVLDGGQRLGKYITHFRNKYFIATPLPFADGAVTYDLYPGADQKIYEAIEDVCIRFDDSEIKMPKRVDIVMRFDLPQNARRIYEDIERDLIARIDHNIVVAKNAGIATHKLRQIANGGLYVGDDDERQSRIIHEEKATIVSDLIEELEGQPALVGFEFRHDRDRLLKHLGKDAPYIDGTVPIKKQNALLTEWNTGKLPFLLTQIGTVAHGLNLQYAGRAVIFHSNVWDYEWFDQFRRRIWRSGATAKRVLVYRIVANNTVDEAIMTSNESRGATQNDMFNALKTYLRKRSLK